MRHFVVPAFVAFLWMPAALRAQTSASPASWVVADSAAKAVTLTLDVTAPPGTASALINGYRAGAAQIVVPLNWTVTWH